MKIKIKAIYEETNPSFEIIKGFAKIAPKVEWAADHIRLFKFREKQFVIVWRGVHNPNRKEMEAILDKKKKFGTISMIKKSVARKMIQSYMQGREEGF